MLEFLAQVENLQFGFLFGGTNIYIHFTSVPNLVQLSSGSSTIIFCDVTLDGIKRGNYLLSPEYHADLFSFYLHPAPKIATNIDRLSFIAYSRSHHRNMNDDTHSTLLAQSVSLSCSTAATLHNVTSKPVSYGKRSFFSTTIWQENAGAVTATLEFLASSPSTSSPPQHIPKPGAIVAGTVCGLTVVLVTLALLFVYIRRRGRSRRHDSDVASTMTGSSLSGPRNIALAETGQPSQANCERPTGLSDGTSVETDSVIPPPAYTRDPLQQ